MSPAGPARRPAQLPGDPPGGRRAAAVWGIGVVVYMVAVVHRTSLGRGRNRRRAAASTSARPRCRRSRYSRCWSTPACRYPSALLVDRLGTKRVLTCGIVLFTTGQLGFALSHAYGTALTSRAVLGCGDAMTFVSVLRLGSRWFPARRGPLIAQSAALFGMAGNLVSTVLLSRLLHSAGWTPTFTGHRGRRRRRAGPGAAVPEGPPGGLRAAAGRTPGAGRDVRRQIAASWREPGTRLGMWVHFTTQFSGDGVPAAVGDAVPGGGRRGCPAARPAGC